MSGKPRKTPSAKAQAYIDAYLRNKRATCHDIDRLFGVEGTTSRILRRWGIPQRYEPGGGNLGLLRDHRPMKKFSMRPVERRGNQKRHAPIPPAPIPLDEVVRRLIERRARDA